MEHIGNYYDKEGKLISFEEWGKLFRAEYKRVAETTLPDGKWISTVWLGIDHGFGMGPPLIFETMVFAGQDDSGDLDMERYSTLTDAIEGHGAMVEKWSTKYIMGET